MIQEKDRIIRELNDEITKIKDIQELQNVKAKYTGKKEYLRL